MQRAAKAGIKKAAEVHFNQTSSHLFRFSLKNFWKLKGGKFYYFTRTTYFISVIYIFSFIGNHIWAVIAFLIGICFLFKSSKKNINPIFPDDELSRLLNTNKNQKNKIEDKNKKNLNSSPNQKLQSNLMWSNYLKKFRSTVNRNIIDLQYRYIKKIRIQL